MNHLDNLVAAQRVLRERLLADPHRPIYHFVAPEGWCMPFDPNGAIYWQGRYHLCCIMQDARGHIWGHASSRDLLHWRWHAPALAPEPGDPDRGIFSGNCFVNAEGAATILYHGVEAGNCIATSTDPGLDRWTKLPANPIVPNPAPGSPEAARYQSWDPHGWWEDGRYWAIFGGSRAAVFTAGALDDWHYVGPLLDREMPDVAPFEDISCPDLFPLGGRHVLLCISHSHGCRYYVGDWRDGQFRPALHRRLNWPGGTCFAPETLLDDRGRRLCWAWTLETRPADGAAWGGVMTLPRVLTLADDGTLHVAPAEELAALHTRHVQLSDLPLPDGRPVSLDDVRGDALELDVTLQPGEAACCGVKVRCAPDGSEETVIACDRDAGCLRIGLARSTLSPDIVYRTYVTTFHVPGGENPPVTAQEAPFALAPGEPLRLRIFLDRSMLEVFANERQCLAQRIYPTRDDSLGITLFAEGGEAELLTLNAWEMAPTNPW